MVVKKISHQVKAGSNSSSCIKDGQGNPAWGLDSQKPAQVPGTGPGPELGAPQTDRSTQLSHTCRGPISVSYRPPSCGS